MRILAFSGSNSSSSINQELIKYSAQFVKLPVDIIDLRNYELPMFSVDEEQRHGYSKTLLSLYNTFIAYDAYMISLPEHNGNYPAFFKNIIDWLSRIERGFFKGKPVLLLNAAPGAHGGKSVLDIARKSFSFFNGQVVETFLLPESGAFVIDGVIKIENSEAKTNLRNALSNFEQALSLAASKSESNNASQIQTSFMV